MWQGRSLGSREGSLSLLSHLENIIDVYGTKNTIAMSTLENHFIFSTTRCKMIDNDVAKMNKISSASVCCWFSHIFLKMVFTR